jgi:hypothetical protein
MHGEPIQFGTVAASRAKRSAAGFTEPVRARKNDRDLKTASVLDEAFADFTRVDAAVPPRVGGKMSVTPNSSSLTQALISGIAMQLETLDNQRHQLARLLESVDTSTTV